MPSFAEIDKEFDEKFYYSRVERPEGTYIYASPNSIKSFIHAKLQEERKKVLEEVQEDFRMFEFDKEAHRNGQCSFITASLCSAEEHSIKLQFKSLIQSLLTGMDCPCRDCKKLRKDNKKKK